MPSPPPSSFSALGSFFVFLCAVASPLSCYASLASAGASENEQDARAAKHPAPPSDLHSSLRFDCVAIDAFSIYFAPYPLAERSPPYLCLSDVFPSEIGYSVFSLEDQFSNPWNTYAVPVACHLCLPSIRPSTIEFPLQYSDGGWGSYLPSSTSSSESHSLASIFDRVIYINLLFRPERRTSILTSLASANISAPYRLDAVHLVRSSSLSSYVASLPNGWEKQHASRLGCSLSHLRALEHAQKEGWPSVLVVEDDIAFVGTPKTFTDAIGKVVGGHWDEFDVLLLAGNNRRNTTDPRNAVSDDGSFVKVTECTTTTGYLVKHHYYKKIIDNIREGIENLLREPSDPFQFSIDVYWMRLQKADRWIMLWPQCATQSPGFSDVQLMEVNYQF